jgi:hypothetical protein
MKASLRLEKWKVEEPKCGPVAIALLDNGKTMSSMELAFSITLRIKQRDRASGALVSDIVGLIRRSLLMLLVLRIVA